MKTSRQATCREHAPTHRKMCVHQVYTDCSCHSSSRACSNNEAISLIHPAEMMQKEVLEAKSSGFGLVQCVCVHNLLRVKLSRSRGGKRLVMNEI